MTFIIYFLYDLLAVNELIFLKSLLETGEYVKLYQTEN
jgi:hypothetical protein